MAQLLVRNLDDDVKARLKARAARHGRSLEAEIRDILALAAGKPASSGDGAGTQIAARFAGMGIDKADIQELRDIRLQIPDFSV